MLCMSPQPSLQGVAVDFSSSYFGCDVAPPAPGTLPASILDERLMTCNALGNSLRLQLPDLLEGAQPGSASVRVCVAEPGTCGGKAALRLLATVD